MKKTPNILVSTSKLTSEIVDFLNSKKTGVEIDFFSFPENLDEKYLDLHIKNYKKLLLNLNEKATLHGAFYDLSIISRDPLIVEVCKYRILQAIDIAEELNIHDIVFHANFIPSARQNYKQLWLKKQTIFWEQFIPLLTKKQIKVHIENTREEDATYIKQLLINLNSPCFGVCLDTGHINCFTNSKIKPSKWVQEYGNYLSYIHLHSNHGLTDEHICFTDGNIDFSDFFEEIDELPNSPLLIIENKTAEQVKSSLEALNLIYKNE